MNGIPRARFAFVLFSKFGSLTLYRFKDFDPHPFTVLGAGQAELIEFSPERIRLRLHGTDANSRLKLHVSYIDHWEARHGGRTLPIVPATTYGIEDPFLMEVPAPDGEITFEYVRRTSDWIGLILSLSAVPAFVGACYVIRRRPNWLTLPVLPPGARRALELTCAGVALVAGAVLAARYRAHAGLARKGSVFVSLGGVPSFCPSREPRNASEKGARGVSTAGRLKPFEERSDEAALRSRRILARSRAENLGHPLADGEMKADGVACTRDGALHWSCGAREVKADRVQAKGYMHTCYTTSATSLEVRTKAKGDFIAGTYDARDGEGTLHAWLDEKDLGSAIARSPDLRQQWVQFDARGRKRDGSSTLRIELTGSPLQCFDFRAVNYAADHTDGP